MHWFPLLFLLLAICVSLLSWFFCVEISFAALLNPIFSMTYNNKYLFHVYDFVSWFWQLRSRWWIVCSVFLILGLRVIKWLLWVLVSHSRGQVEEPLFGTDYIVSSIHMSLVNASSIAKCKVNGDREMYSTHSELCMARLWEKKFWADNTTIRNVTESMERE